jgi:hypothetical protein
MADETCFILWNVATFFPVMLIDNKLCANPIRRLNYCPNLFPFFSNSLKIRLFCALRGSVSRVSGIGRLPGKVFQLSVRRESH